MHKATPEKPKIDHFPPKLVKMEPKLFRQFRAVCVQNDLRSSLVVNNLLQEFIDSYEDHCEDEAKLAEFIQKYKKIRFHMSI